MRMRNGRTVVCGMRWRLQKIEVWGGECEIALVVSSVLGNNMHEIMETYSSPFKNFAATLSQMMLKCPDYQSSCIRICCISRKYHKLLICGYHQRLFATFAVKLYCMRTETYWTLEADWIQWNCLQRNIASSEKSVECIPIPSFFRPATQNLDSVLAVPENIHSSVPVTELLKSVKPVVDQCLSDHKVFLVLVFVQMLLTVFEGVQEYQFFTRCPLKLLVLTARIVYLSLAEPGRKGSRGICSNFTKLVFHSLTRSKVITGLTSSNEASLFPPSNAVSCINAVESTSILATAVTIIKVSSAGIA